MVTVWALCSGVIPALFFVLYDAKLYDRYPAILYIIAAIGIFLYQTLDALDGKQARRIKAFSPLGQLFDHGCDSFSTAAMLIHILVCLRVPDANINLMCYLAYITTVYMSNVCEKFTGVMMTSYGQIGVTEIQLSQCAFLLLCACGATDFIYTPIIGKYGLNYLIAIAIISSGFISFVVFLKKIFDSEKNIETIIKTIIPLGYVFAMGNNNLKQSLSL